MCESTTFITFCCSELFDFPSDESNDKDSDRFNQYRTGMNVLFKYVPDFSSPIMIEGTIRNIVTNGSGKKLEYIEVEALKSKLMHFITGDEIYATVERT